MNKLFIGCLSIILLAGCRNDQSQKKEEKEEGLEPLAYTLYTDKTELFVEFKPLVVGEESRFAAHFTALGESFKPIISGSVTLTLQGTSGNQSITAQEPSNPGIFRLALKPAKAGLYKLVFDISTPAYTDQVVIDSIPVYAEEKTALEKQVAEPAGSNEITYLKEQAWKIDFATMPVNKTSFANVVKTSGVIMSAPGDEQTIAAKTAGIVKLANTGLFAGTAIRAGQSLFTVSSSGLTDNNAGIKLQEAKNNLSRSKADFERNQQLFNDRLITQKDYLQSKNEYENAQTLYNGLSRNYGAAGQYISATTGGFVKSLLVTEGQFVEAGQPLAVIAKNKKLVVKAEISQTVFSSIGDITSANFKINNQVVSLEQLHGRLVSIGKAAENSLFIPVIFEMDNAAALVSGTYLEVLIKTAVIPDALVIPTAALIEEQGNYYCYVQTAGETFEKRQLQLGGNDGLQVQVLSGITEYERVVTKGAYNIKLSTASGTLPAHGHEH